MKISDIIIGPRQRIELGDLTDLDSMADTEVGQILPIVIDSYNNLIDGRRRLAKAVELGWSEVHVIIKSDVNEITKQKMELFADIGRKDRTWQEKCIAMFKVNNLISSQKAGEGLKWTIDNLAAFTGYTRVPAMYMLEIGELLLREPRDIQLWECSGYRPAIDCLRDRVGAAAFVELERRNQSAITAAKQMAVHLATPSHAIATIAATQNSPSLIASQSLPETLTSPLTLRQRAELYNKAYEQLGPPNTPFYYSNKNNREFILAHWFVGGGNVSEFYGSYQTQYLERIQTLFPDSKKVVHLFSGSLPPSDKYTRVGQDPTGKYKSDLEINIHQLSTYLPFKPDLIYADPPYSVEDSEHYQNSMINCKKVMDECGLVLQSGGFLVWMDQSLPVFSNEVFQFVGLIAYIRSTGNRFRCVCIFRKV